MMSNSINTNLDKVKILIVGDSGVGKTSLVHLITYQEVLKKPTWTIGCSVEVKLHEFKDGTLQHQSYFIELYDIGGKSAHKQYQRIFYSGVDGVILVHDLTNRKSEENLKYWLQDVIDQNENLSIASTDLGASFLSSSSPNTSASQPLMGSYNNPNMPPLLLAGTKQDLAELNRISTSSKRLFGYKADVINLNCLQQNHLAPGSSNSIVLAKFFDKVIDYKRSQKNREITNKSLKFGNSSSSNKQSEYRYHSNTSLNHLD